MIATIFRRSLAWSPALSILVGVVASACSSPDPGAIHFAPRADGGTSSTPFVDSGGGGLEVDASSFDSAAPADASSEPATGDAAADAGIDAADASGTPAVISATLVDTSITNVVAGSPVTGFDPIKDGSTISLAQVGTNLSIRANLNVATIGSVGFAYDQTNHTENATPYTLCGDDGAGTITNCNLAEGAHTLTVTPYSLADLGGTAGTALTIHFTITP